jgi:hypothetical protein
MSSFFWNITGGVYWNSTDLLEEHVSIFKVEEKAEQETSVNKGAETCWPNWYLFIVLA